MYWAKHQLKMDFWPIDQTMHVFESSHGYNYNWPYLHTVKVKVLNASLISCSPSLRDSGAMPFTARI